MYDNGTEIAEFVEEHGAVQIEIKEKLYTRIQCAQHGCDTMGRFIVEDRMSRMMPKPKINSKKKRWRLRMEMFNQPKADIRQTDDIQELVLFATSLYVIA